METTDEFTQEKWNVLRAACERFNITRDNLCDFLAGYEENMAMEVEEVSETA